MREQLSVRDRIALVFFFLILFLMGFLQYMQYFDISNKNIKNIVVILISVIAIGAAVTKKRWMTIDRKNATIILFLLYALFIEIFTNTFTLENFYYLSVSFFTIIGGYSFGESYSKARVISIVKTVTILSYIILSLMFFQNFFLLGFVNAGVQTSIVYPLVLFVLIGCFFGDNITLICSVPMIYAGFVLMARSVILLTVSIVLIRLLLGGKNKGSVVKKLVLFSLFCAMGIYLFEYALQGSGSNIFQKTVLRGGDFSSGRNEIYIESLQYFAQSSILTMLFGNGADTATKLFGISGHSDFIQFLLNFGLVGMVWFAKIQFDCIRTVKRHGLTAVKYIEIAVLIFYMTINQFFLAVGPSTLYGFIIGMLAGQLIVIDESGME